MKLTTDEGFAVEGTEDEIARLLKSLRNGHLPSEDRQTLDAVPAQGHRGIHNERALKAVAHVDRSSRYYSVKRARHSRVMAATYEYVAGYKNGRTIQQMSEHLGAPNNTISTRMGRLIAEGLVVRCGGRFGHYVATNTETPVPVHPSPADMPQHRECQ